MDNNIIIFKKDIIIIIIMTMDYILNRAVIKVNKNI